MTPTDIDTREGHVSDVDAFHEFKREGMRTARLHAPPTEDDSKKLYQAYSDSSKDYLRGSGKRSLFYYSDALFTADELLKGFSSALAHGDRDRWDYNKFDKYSLQAVFDVFGHAPAINIGESAEPDGSSVSSFYFLLDELLIYHETIR